MDTVGTLSLILATLTMGLVTGAFVVFWHTIMPGLATTDDRTFVSAFQSIDKAPLISTRPRCWRSLRLSST